MLGKYFSSECVEVGLIVKGFAPVYVTDDAASQQSLSVLFGLAPVAGQSHQQQPVDQLLAAEHARILLQLPPIKFHKKKCKKKMVEKTSIGKLWGSATRLLKPDNLPSIADEIGDALVHVEHHKLFARVVCFSVFGRLQFRSSSTGQFNLFLQSAIRC